MASNMISDMNQALCDYVQLAAISQMIWHRSDIGPVLPIRYSLYHTGITQVAW